MTTSFTPRTIIKKRRYQLLAGLLLIALASSTTYYLTLPNTSNAATTYTWSTNTDLALGTTASTTVNTSPDSVTLSLKGTSTIETTEEQFLSGHSSYDEPYPIVVNDQAGGEVALDQSALFIYTETSTPALGRKSVRQAFLAGNLLYVVSYNGGLSVINTQGTTDPGDDTLVITYNTGSSPALVSNSVSHAFVSGNLLYVSINGGGLSVINTQGTTDPGDDTLVTRYHTGSTPALVGNFVNYSFLAGNLLHVITTGGLTVINTQGTTDPSDDTLVANYNTGSTPAIVDSAVEHAFLNGNLLYVSTIAGLSVINTEGTTDPGDDTLVITYNIGSTPALGNSYVSHAFLASDLLYVSTGGGLFVINTQGTTDPGDDVLVTTYDAWSTPSIVYSDVEHAFLNGNLLYVSTFLGGLSVINTQGTNDPGDDTLVANYNTVSAPALESPVVSSSFLAGNLLYVSTDDGLSVIDLFGNYRSPASYQSPPQVISDTPTGALSFDYTEAAGQTVSLQYRTGDNDAAWTDGFYNATTTEYLGDFYDWGNTFNDATENEGVIRLSNPNPYSSFFVSQAGVNFWLDTGETDDYFPIGSIVTARVRINSDTAVDAGQCMYNDDWWDEDCLNNIVLNEWFTTSFVASSEDFSKIGFNVYWEKDTWAPTDSFEIGWLQIETPDSSGHWNAWSTPCTDNTSCPIDQADLVGNEWIQYKLNLTTSDPHTTPSVNSVTWMSGYESGGAYTSNTKSFNQSQDLLTFDASADTPTGTSIAYAYTVNGGQTWLPITPGAQFPRGTTAESFAWKATLTSTNPLVTPTINSITITTVTHEENTTTSTNVAVRVANLEAQGRQAEAEALREKYSNNQLSDADVKREIIIILNKVITILKRLAELEG